MATTGFWPVKDRLKEVIDYAENPNKTIEKSMWTAIYTPPCDMFPMAKRPTSVCMSAASTATQSGRMSV